MSVTAGERRVVAVLVADVVGSTAIAERLGPERSKFLFDEIVGLMREEVLRFDGTVAQLTGDGVLVLFGAPVAREDDSERAVRAGLAIGEALDRYAGEVASAYGVELRARVAINTGPVIVPEGDAPPDALYNALGDTVNVAARLQALGELIVGPATARQVKAVFELEPLGELQLKGRTDPVSAFRVVGMRTERAAVPEAQLVGREEELGLLTDALDRVADGQGAIVAITGEPGIGKSRLVAEVEERLSGRIQFLFGHAVAYAATIPYWPVRELLRAWLDVGVSDPEARVRLELRTGLAHTLAGEAEDAYPFLARLLGLTLEEDQARGLQDLAPDAVQQETFYWLDRLVSVLARERSLCLVMEDLHWSDEATLTLLEELLPVVEQAAVAFVLIHRSDPDHPAWRLVDRTRRRFRRAFSELELEPLGDADARSLAVLNAGAKLPQEVAEQLVARAGGNPYFVCETVRDLRERGSLDGEGGAVPAGDALVPAAIQEALQARLGRLDVEARELVATAAVIGRSFGYPLLERLLPRSRLPATLSELEWLELVVEVRGGPAPEYRFRHGLVQEVAYGTLIEARRRELHLRVGEALVELNRDSPEEVDGLLAHHFAEADEPARASEYLLGAGDAARAAYAEEEALGFYRRALGFLERTGDEGRARETLLKIALTHHLAFDYPAAAAAFDEAFARPAATPMRLEPTERLSWATAAGWPVDKLAPGLGSDSDLASWVTCNLFRGLVSIGERLEIEPDLAERFSVSDDGRSYRFTLRPDAVWSDGEPVTAHDFAFTFAHMVGEGLAWAPRLAGVRASAVDDRTLEIELDEPKNYFLYLLGQTALFAWPRHVCEARGSGWYAEVPLVSCGPFVLSEHDARPDARSHGRITLESAPTWYGARGNVGQVTIAMQLPDESGDRWVKGEFDLVYEFVAELAGIAIDDDTVVQRAPGGFTDYLGLDARRPPLDDARVRLAVAHAIDREAMPLAIGGTPAATGGILPPAIPGHSHRVAPPFDPDRARARLSDAGHPDGRGLGEIVLTHFAVQEQTASVVATQLEAVGLRVRRLPVHSVAVLAEAIEERAHAYIWACGYEFPDPGTGLLEPLVRWGTGLYRDERLEQLLVRATSVRDRGERLRACREFERLWIGEQAALVPLTYNDRLLWRRPWVSGLWANAIARSTFAEAVVTRPS